MAGIFDRFPQWRQWWSLVQDSARRFGMNPNETLAVHIFENGAADPNIHGPLAKGATAVGLAQIWDKTISRSTNSRGWGAMVARWNLRDGQNIESLKTNPRFATDYLAWRMAGSRRKAGSVDEWYKRFYNPGFGGDARGPGPSIYLTDNPRTRADSGGGVPFPVAGHGTGDISSVWGDPRDGGARRHEGVDIAAPRGTPLIAVADGKVSLRTGGAGGNAVFIDGTYYYAHLSRFAVEEGQRVRKGDVIGYVGSTGTSSSGPHLHFSIFKNGKAVNPLSFLQAAETGGGGVDSDLATDPFFEPPSAFDVFFPGQQDGGIPLPGGGPGLPGGGPTLPATGFSGVFQRRDMTETWRLIAQQEDVSPETTQFAGALDEEPV